MEPDTVVSQLQFLVAAHKNTQKGLLAYTVLQYLLFAIENGKPEHVLNNPEFQTIFMDARLATDCGWRPSPPP